MRATVTASGDRRQRLGQRSVVKDELGERLVPARTRIDVEDELVLGNPGTDVGADSGYPHQYAITAGKVVAS